MNDKELNDKLDEIERHLDRIASSLEKLSMCIDECNKMASIEGNILVSEDR